ncbi:MAG TPA: aldo/keto reductase [Burkholderiales bacterium]|nr:aldo/keto reductase [Burkholderiales bacterium]
MGGNGQTRASPSSAIDPSLDLLHATRRGDMPYRKLGRTGAEVSLIGVGGSHIGEPDDEQESIRIIRSAIDAGVNFLDNCWDYKGGECELRMGKALRDGYRDKVFLMTKIDGRTREAAAGQIDESLRRLQTDRLDLLQFHEVIRLEDPDRIFSEEGAVEAVEAARAAGKVRFVGFTGHKDPIVHLRMLDIARDHGFHFDTVQMPLNAFDAHFRSFEHAVLPVAIEQDIGVLAMKSIGGGILLDANVVSARECLHYAMSLPVATVITGIDSMQILRQALDAARTFKPLTPAEREALLERTRDAACTGRYERFKTTSVFDGTAQHPAWLG